MKIKIADKYFNELKNTGSTTPRDSKGDTLNLRVGGIYEVRSNDISNTEVLRAKNTQNCPCHLIIY